ncbi:MAG TPA: RND transporter, partial [Planctomycetaceae bacterium]|nr:RND transporter [Planctomycetaceae bacterium]
VGTALIMTTVILVAGFSTVIFSDMRDQRNFAIMSGLTISSALFGDLVFLPALLARYAKRSQVPAMEEPEELSDPMVEQTLVRE